MQQGDFDMSIGWSDKGITPYNFFKWMMFTEYVKPVGETADVNWHRFGLKEADLLIKELEQTSDDNEIKNIIFQLQHLLLKMHLQYHFLQSLPGESVIQNISQISLVKKIHMGHYLQTKYLVLFLL